MIDSITKCLDNWVLLSWLSIEGVPCNSHVRGASSQVVVHVEFGLHHD